MGSYDIKFTTPTVQAVTYKWELLENSLVDEWSYSMCDYGACHIELPQVSTMSPITQQENQDGTEGFFKLVLNPMNVYGEGWLKLFVYDEANPSLGDTVSYHVIFQDPATIGVNENEMATLNAYPNPVVDHLTIDLVEASTIQVYTIEGKLIHTEQAAMGQKANINLSWMEKGV